MPRVNSQAHAPGVLLLSNEAEQCSISPYAENTSFGIVAAESAKGDIDVHGHVSSIRERNRRPSADARTSTNSVARCSPKERLARKLSSLSPSPWLTRQFPYCIRGHTAGALKASRSPEEIMERIWVAAEMRAGAAYAHSTIVLDGMQAYEEKH